jgi:hypothetical protein
MKTTSGGNGFSWKRTVRLARATLSGGLLSCAAISALAQPVPPDTNSPPVCTPICSWSFSDTNTWTSDRGYAPRSFSGISSAFFGDFTSLVVNGSSPAWLQYNCVEQDNTTNVCVDTGSCAFWFATAWAGTNAGGVGSGQWGRLLSIGNYTDQADFGWFCLYVDDVGANLYFTVQPGDGSTTTCLAAPIEWTSNYWHFITLTYSSSNTALYLDGALATNGAGLTAWPGPDVLAGGFYFCSDSNGLNQAGGALDDLYTYNVPLDADAVLQMFNSFYADYYLVPWNAMPNLVSAPSNPSTNAVAPDAITGAGYLQLVGPAATCVNGANPYQVWITNVTAAPASNGTMNITFTIQGGQDGFAYDVFATGNLKWPMASATWSWMGQGFHCKTYTIPGITNASTYILLGTPLDSDQDSLTDAYETLISHTNPHNPYSNLDGILDGWEVLLGLNPQTSNLTSSNTRALYGYTPAEWLNQVSGAKSGTVNLDNEGNVLSVSQ